jgi:UDP-N-acetylglucosamine:LPS N-acetylglucosamine transferase
MPLPTASVVVDFAAHGLWVDPDVDVHFCLHEDQASHVRALGAPGAVVSGPVVGPQFARGQNAREAARRSLGLDDSDRLVLVVAGSWGAGRIEHAARVLGADPRFRTFAVTGRNQQLRQRLERLRGVEVFGWVDDMAALVVAADVVIENAGGLMAMEAMAMGTPVVSYKPIPGHGRENVARMEEAGISRYAHSKIELVALCDRLCRDEPYRRRLMTTAAGMFRSDVADYVGMMVYHSTGWRDEGLASA